MFSFCFGVGGGFLRLSSRFLAPSHFAAVVNLLSSVAFIFFKENA